MYSLKYLSDKLNQISPPTPPNTPIHENVQKSKLTNYSASSEDDDYYDDDDDVQENGLLKLKDAQRGYFRNKKRSKKDTRQDNIFKRSFKYILRSIYIGLYSLYSIIYTLLYIILYPIIFIYRYGSKTFKGGDIIQPRHTPPDIQRTTPIDKIDAAYNISSSSSKNLVHHQRARSITSMDNSMSEDNQSLTDHSGGEVRRRSSRIKMYNNLKSPTSPSAIATGANNPTKKTKKEVMIHYPLLSKHRSQKTLVLDLDETLVHSMSKGGKMSSAHMVEVRLDKHAILYYVYKRPHCDEFLRQVCKWYDVVIFTASVQEYADPVIDWLEQERKLFKGRYYRQHCTFRNGSYVKDLASIEADLGKVLIIDNSPLSYAFHPDNAVPINGWILDPSDNDLLALLPFLQGLQYALDVRALLSLKRGVTVKT